MTASSIGAVPIRAPIRAKPIANDASTMAADHEFAWSAARKIESRIPTATTFTPCAAWRWFAARMQEEMHGSLRGFRRHNLRY